MKKYNKPSIEVLVVEAMSQMMQSTSLELHNGTGDGSTGQLAPGKKDIIIDDEEDRDYGW